MSQCGGSNGKVVTQRGIDQINILRVMGTKFLIVREGRGDIENRMNSTVTGWNQRYWCELNFRYRQIQIEMIDR